MIKRIIEFIKSEEGGIVEWLIVSVIIGIGSIPIILGIASAINSVSQAGEESIRSIIWTK